MRVMWVSHMSWIILLCWIWVCGWPNGSTDPMVYKLSGYIWWLYFHRPMLFAGDISMIFQFAMDYGPLMVYLVSFRVVIFQFANCNKLPKARSFWILNGPVEIVDLPIKHGDFPSFFVCLPEARPFLSPISWFFCFHDFPVRYGP